MRGLQPCHRFVDHAAEVSQFPTLVTEAGPGLEVAGRHLASRGDDRADLAEEQRLADQPGNQETEERRDHQKDDVAEERRGQGRAIGGQGNAERDARARTAVR